MRWKRMVDAKRDTAALAGEKRSGTAADDSMRRDVVHPGAFLRAGPP